MTIDPKTRFLVGNIVATILAIAGAVGMYLGIQGTGFLVVMSALLLMNIYG